MFLTTHYMDEAERVAHRIAIIDHGKIVAQDTPQALKDRQERHLSRMLTWPSRDRPYGMRR